MRADALDMTAQALSLSEAGRRLANVRREIAPLLKARPNASVETDWPRLGQDIDLVDTPVRVYAIDGLQTEIVIPETFACKLDAVRRARMAGEGASSELPTAIDERVRYRALPEDFLPHLDALPRSKLVEKLILLDEPSPLDPWHRRAAGDPHFEAQASADRYAITFYRKNIDAYIGDELRHEWCHIASAHLPFERSWFDRAAVYERHAYAPRERVHDDADERWAILLGEEMLARDGARFLTLVAAAPVQSVFLACALRSLLDDPETTPSAGLLARLQYIDETVRQSVVEGLVEDARHHEDRRNDAARLLIFLDEGQRLDDVPEVTSLDLSRDRVGSGLLRLRNNRHITHLNLDGTFTSQLDCLKALPLRTLSLASTHIRGSALSDLVRIETLETLDISYNAINFVGALSLRRLPRLERLHARGIDVTAEEMKLLRGAMPKTQIVF